MKLFKKIILLYIITLAAFISLIVSVYAIPTTAVKDNIIKSARQIQKEGLWFQPMGFYLFQIDNMTDCQMMHINAYADSERPVYSAMMADNATPYVNGDTRAYKNMATTTLEVAEKGREAFKEHKNYARYWHGYQIVLRPLLCFLDYTKIRVLNYVALGLLLVATAIMMYKKLGAAYTATFLVTLTLTNAIIIPLAIQFSTCFYISMLAMLFFLAKPATLHKRNNTILVFFSIGAVTSYMDFLTTPLLTLGFPLVITTALSGRHVSRTRHVEESGVAWMCGYASLWASKWIVAWALTGENIIYDAILNARLRIGDTIVYGGKEMTMSHFFDLINEKVASIVNPLWIAAASVAAIIIVLAYFYRNWHCIRQEKHLLLIAMMPLLWFAVMKNHSLQHIFFTWRDWMLTLWCALLILYKTYKMRKQHENSCTNTML